MKNAAVFTLGMAAGAAALFIMGAGPGGDAGRYQISAYATSSTHGVYVLDTNTGAVKAVSYGKGTQEYPSQVGVPFDKMGNMPRHKTEIKKH